MLERAPSVSHGSARLAERRRTRRRRGLIAFAILLLLLLAAADYGLWQSSVRISRVNVFGADASFAEYATREMQGSYFGIIPRDSILFFPASSIRADILADHPDIAAVSIFRNSLTGISIKTTERAPIARWCGPMPSAARFDLNATSSRSNLAAQENCYVFDAGGLIFAPAATSTQTINNFRLYAPLDSARGEPPVVSEVEPLLATIARADKLPTAFDFARQLGTFSPVTEVILRDDEVDDILASGTRITYVLGHENNAFTALISSRDTFNLTDGSVDYVDLRFDRKVYVKKK